VIFIREIDNDNVSIFAGAPYFKALFSKKYGARDKAYLYVCWRQLLFCFFIRLGYLCMSRVVELSLSIVSKYGYLPREGVCVESFGQRHVMTFVHFFNRT